MSEARFYTVTDAEFFPGTVALVNSLRLMGHDEELVVLDNGLTRPQRERLEPFASIVGIPASTTMAPTTLKPAPYFVKPEGTVVFLDSDMIVGASLTPVLELAARGRICLFPDNSHQRARWFAEWEELFGLRTTPRRQTYFNCGFVAFSADHWPELLSAWWAACSRIPGEHVFGAADHPLCYGDQDALNAILMSEIDPDAVSVLPYEQLANPDGSRFKVVNQEELVCERNGSRLVLLHHWDRPKAWDRSLSGLQRLAFPEAYLRVFPRVACGPDVALPLGPEEVPWWLRPGRRHTLALRCGTSLHRVVWPIRLAVWALMAAPRRLVDSVRRRRLPGQIARSDGGPFNEVGVEVGRVGASGGGAEAVRSRRRWSRG